MKPAKFIRVGNMVFKADNHGVLLRDGKKRQPVLHQQFSSTNQAKKECRKLQTTADKGLGRGSVKVMTK